MADGVKEHRDAILNGTLQALLVLDDRDRDDRRRNVYEGAELADKTLRIRTRT